ncbi:peptidase inhibitor family I36 protein [Amycolatopsis lexingtonensis]|uniref:peptidase inhibitor family I36 protein n=1 Tax=Amycolatopsis lexingtonensis TaxID=218822 RepID=UPI003F71766E
MTNRMGKYFGVAAAVAMAATAWTAAPAFAGTTNETAAFTCAPGWFCTWDAASGEGRGYNFQEGARDLMDLSYNDSISAVYNRSGQIFCLYEHAKGQGRSLAISLNYRSAIPAKYNFDNITSSIGAANSRGECDRDVPGA